MLPVLGCITNEHHLPLVAATAFLLAFSCWTTAMFLSRARFSHGRQSGLWTAAAGFVFGAGVWATHFIAMLAFQISFPISYAVDWTAYSIGIAVVLSAFGFSLV